LKIDPLKTFWGNILGGAIPVITFVIAAKLLWRYGDDEKRYIQRICVDNINYFSKQRIMMRRSTNSAT